jgi:molecular chaperone DnaK
LRCVRTLTGSDLPEGVKIAKGDQINNHWHVDEGGLLTASVELPGVGLRYEEKRSYCPEIGHRPFEGEGGGRLAESALEEVENDLEQASQVVANGADSELEDVRRRLARQRDQLEQALDADDRRSATEEARRLRHEIARMLRRPEHRGAVLSRQLAELKGAFNYRAREIADADAARRFDELASKAVLELARGRAGFATAEQQLEEMHGIMMGALWRDPRFVAEAFNSLAAEGHLALDRERLGQLVAAGSKALARGDIDGLRDLVGEMIDNRLRGAAGSGVPLCYPDVPIAVCRIQLTYWTYWCRREDSNLRPTDYESAALPLSYSGPRKAAAR